MYTKVRTYIGHEKVTRARRTRALSTILGALVLALVLVLPAVAGATPRWYKSGTAIGEGGLGNQKLAWSKGSFQIRVTSKAFPSIYMHQSCENSGTGLAEAAGKGEIKTLTFSCKSIGENWCGSTVTAEGVGLPWATQLYRHVKGIEESLSQEIPSNSNDLLKFYCKSTNVGGEETAYCPITHTSGTQTGWLPNMTNETAGVKASVSAGKLNNCWEFVGGEATGEIEQSLQSIHLEPNEGKLEVKFS